MGAGPGIGGLRVGCWYHIRYNTSIFGILGGEGGFLYTLGLPLLDPALLCLHQSTILYLEPTGTLQIRDLIPLVPDPPDTDLQQKAQPKGIIVPPHNTYSSALHEATLSESSSPVTDYYKMYQDLMEKVAISLGIQIEVVQNNPQ